MSEPPVLAGQDLISDGRFWHAVLTAHGCEAEVLHVEPVGRAWSNRVYRVCTSAGVLAVKDLLNPWGDPHWREWLEEAAHLEHDAIQAGVRAPDLVTTRDGGLLSSVDDSRGHRHTLRVHHWLEDAVPCPGAPVTDTIAEAVGSDLARVHQLGRQPRRPEVFPVATAVTGREWGRLVESLARVSPEWADRTAAVAGEVGRIVAWFEEWEQTRQPTLMSHGDVDPKNLVVDRAGDPWWVDWDVAAPWRPGDELARTAVSLAGWERPDVARTVVQAYGERAGLIPVLGPLNMTLDLVIGLDWIARCLRRAAGLEDCDPQRRREATAMAGEALDAMPTAVASAAALDDWLTP